MFKFIFIIIIIILLLLKWKNHVLLKYKTFFQKGFFKSSKPYGVYCYCGKQGKGKTYSVIEFLLENTDKEIYCNISSIKGLNYHYINGIDQLLSLRGKTNCIIVFDEIFTILQKGTKMNNEILDFLSQMRKREMIFITTAQEWLEINMTLRRYCRYQIECNMISIFGYPILIKSMYNAEKMHWSLEDNEYVAPILSTTISHGLKRVIDSYDTYEIIGDFAKTNVNKDEFSIADSLSENQQENENSIELLHYDYSNSIVNSQFTNDFTQDNSIKELSASPDFSNIDNDFWGNIDSSDFDSNVK